MKRKGRKSKGFTLIELLVVIAIIALLISILMPSLARAKGLARRTICLANQHHLGIAMNIYLNENNYSYPVCYNWGSMVGWAGIQVGAGRWYDDAPANGGYTGWPGDKVSGVAVKSRPLNRYLTSPKAAECPDDKGDSYDDPAFAPITNCYKYYGTSYLVQWQIDSFGVRHVTGFPGYDPLRADSKEGPMDKKYILSDWNWHGNRPLSNPRTWWHNPERKRMGTVLWGDGHSNLLTKFPADFETNYWPPISVARNGFW
jgi:prepilin-type N-terminal cleavage/methylation domain-containing protein